MFILSIKAGGTGLNLMRANHVFRIGQTRNVQVHKYLCAGTLEEKIDDMIER